MAKVKPVSKARRRRTKKPAAKSRPSPRADLPDSVDSILTKALGLEQSGDHAAAAQSFAKAMRVRPHFEDRGFSNALGMSYRQVAERAKAAAVAAIERQFGGGLTDARLAGVMPILAVAEHVLGNLDAADHLYRHCMSKGYDPYMSATGYTMVRQQLGDAAGYRYLVDYSKFPVTFDVDTERGRRKIAAWNETMFATILSHPSLAREVHAESPVDKYITDTFTQRDTMPGPVAELAELIAEKVDHLRATLTPVAGHPFFGKIPRRYRIEIFGALLDAGGHHSPHVHTDSWVSGAYYARVPNLAADRRKHAGCLEFGKYLFLLGDGFAGERRYLKPREGLMAIWPSYFIHNTVPCRDARQRLTMGFNVYAAD